MDLPLFDKRGSWFSDTKHPQKGHMKPQYFRKVSKRRRNEKFFLLGLLLSPESVPGVINSPTLFNHVNRPFRTDSGWSQSFCFSRKVTPTLRATVLPLWWPSGCQIEALPSFLEKVKQLAMFGGEATYVAAKTLQPGDIGRPSWQHHHWGNSTGSWDLCGQLGPRRYRKTFKLLLKLLCLLRS